MRSLAPANAPCRGDPSPLWSTTLPASAGAPATVCAETSAIIAINLIAYPPIVDFEEAASGPGPICGELRQIVGLRKYLSLRHLRLTSRRGLPSHAACINAPRKIGRSGKGRP
jgi:hypothetical protein